MGNKIDNWYKKYELAKIYYEHYGDLDVPYSFKTSNGYEYDLDGISLGTWLYTQRRAYKKALDSDGVVTTLLPLSDEKIDLLRKIGMEFDYYEAKWNKMYELAKVYYEQYNNLDIPHNFNTFNGCVRDEDGYELGSWLHRQELAFRNRDVPRENWKSMYLPLTDERVEKLESIGMKFGVNYNEEEWNKYYKLAKAYYDKYGNLDIPQNFVTNNGIDVSNGGYKLGSWLDRQLDAYRNRSIPKDKRKTTYLPLSDERVELLSNIGMKFDAKTHEEKWNEMFFLAKSYYDFYGHLKVPANFKTSNGYLRDAQGFNLNNWLVKQRKAYKNRSISKRERTDKVCPLSLERVYLLESVGMVWSVQKNKINVIELCNKYDIDYNINKSLLNKSYNELYVKICYLLDNNLFVTINGEVHEIFNMSDTNMKVKYGVSFSELLDRYVNGKTRGF